MSQETVLQSQYFSATSDMIFAPANVSARDFRHISLEVNGSGGSTFSIRVLGSLQMMNQGALVETPPDFTSPQSPTNNWSYIEIKPDDSGSFLPGITGFDVAADGTYNFELNTNVLAWVTVEVFNYVTGTFLGQFTFKNNA